jgi:P-aminobenzoate N-oxygenase AurF
MHAVAAVQSNDEVPVDFGRNFIPEALTPLSYTPVYRRLEARHRLRYNQLQALYFNEQIVFFETLVGAGLMQGLLREQWPEGFSETLRQFWHDEIRHTEMFRRLNRRCAPQLYSAGDSHFIAVPPALKAILHWTTRRPRFFSLYIWLMLLQEERSLYYSAQYMRHKEALEPHFVAVYRAHLIDEAGHVRCDQDLLDHWWPRVPAHVRRINARLLAWMVREFFSVPRRGQLNVVDTLAWEFPELRDRVPELKRQMLSLAADERYQLSLYSREITPRCFARFDQWPEFRVLERAMPGYRFLGSEAA